jgi:hypothetical protein
VCCTASNRTELRGVALYGAAVCCWFYVWAGQRLVVVFVDTEEVTGSNPVSPTYIGECDRARHAPSAAICCRVNSWAMAACPFRTLTSVLDGLAES